MTGGPMPNREPRPHPNPLSFRTRILRNAKDPDEEPALSESKGSMHLGGAALQRCIKAFL